MSHWLRALDNLPEDSGSILNTYMLPSRGSDAFFLPLQTPGMHVVHRHSCRQSTHTHKQINKNFKKDVLVKANDQCVPN